MKHGSRRVTAVVTLLALSAITGVVSYEHGLDVVRWVGTTGFTAYLVPIVPDLMIVAASMTLLEASAMGMKRPLAAVAALVVGIGWTVAANVAAGAHGGIGGALVAAGVPIAFLLVLEALLWLVRNTRPVSPAIVTEAVEHAPEVVTETAPVGVPEPITESVSESTPESAPVTRTPSRTRNRAKSAPGKRTRKVAPEVHFADEIASGNLPSIRRIRSELHVGQDKGKEILAQLESSVRHPAANRLIVVGEGQ